MGCLPNQLDLTVILWESTDSFSQPGETGILGVATPAYLESIRLEKNAVQQDYSDALGSIVAIFYSCLGSP